MPTSPEPTPDSMNETGKTSMRLAHLSGRLASARQSDRDRYGLFFAALSTRVAGARAVELELDRMLARSFNALDYLRTDEHGLSKVVADLIDPSSAHGQGSTFLERFMEMAGPVYGGPYALRQPHLRRPYN